MLIKSFSVGRFMKLAAIALAATLSIQISSGTAQAIRTSAAATREARFSDYPVQPYSGTRRAPSFSGVNRKYRHYQTEIKRGFASNPLFAGNFVLIGIGCGTGCMFVYVGDVATGGIFDFPLGGEEHYMLQYETRPTSRLVKVTWNQVGDSTTQCVKEDLIFSGSSFQRRRVGLINRLCSW